MDIIKDYVDYFIFLALGIMSFIVVWFSAERAIFYMRLELSSYDNEEVLERDLSKNLTGLYIVYSNAPYIGLLGTVLGIMITFYDMGMSGGMDAKSIMIGLSTALKATAMGLVVAIPTLIIYNCFLRVMDVRLSRFKERRQNEQKGQ